MSELSAETRRLLQLSRGGDDPPPARELLVRDRLVARLGVTALAGLAAAAATGSVGAASTGASSTAFTLGKTLMGVMVAAGLGVGALSNDGAVAWVRDVIFLVTGDNAPTSPAKREHASGEQPPAMGHDDIDDSVDRDPRRHRMLISIARSPGRPVAIESELVLVERAERALAAKDYPLATRYLDRHETKFADGSLRERREALRVLVGAKANF